MATYDLTQSIPAQLVAGDILNCPYSGAPVEIQLPPGRYKLECWGAQGGDANINYCKGGRGGYSRGILKLKQYSAVFLRSGQAGPVPNQKGPSEPALNGGGSGNTTASTSSVSRITSGGGASDVRIGVDSLFARVIVAGAGGGSGFASSSQACDGGFGGGMTGGSGEAYSSYAREGYGGTQTEGGGNGYATPGNYGTFGQGGNDITSAQGGSGGGGGWYGGGASDGYYCGGGGGSGFVWVGENAPDGYLLTEDHYLSIAATFAGSEAFLSPDGTEETGHTGDGFIRISVISLEPGSPENFRQTGRGLETVGLAWDAAAGADGYRVYRDGLLVADTTDTFLTDTGAEPYSVHNYTLVAYNASGDSEAVQLLTSVVPDNYALDLVTDRTAADVRNNTPKGSYRASDLNRVGTAMVHIADRLRAAGYVVAVDPKLDWTDEDWVDPEAAAHYLGDVAELKQQFKLLSTTPALPSDLEAFSYGEANNIEKILEDIDQLLSNILAGQMWCSGDLYSGEV